MPAPSPPASDPCRQRKAAHPWGVRGFRTYEVTVQRASALRIEDHPAPVDVVSLDDPQRRRGVGQRHLRQARGLFQVATAQRASPNDLGHAGAKRRERFLDQGDFPGIAQSQKESALFGRAQGLHGGLCSMRRSSGSPDSGRSPLPSSSSMPSLLQAAAIPREHEHRAAVPEFLSRGQASRPLACMPVCCLPQVTGTSSTKCHSAYSVRLKHVAGMPRLVRVAAQLGAFAGDRTAA